MRIALVGDLVVGGDYVQWCRKNNLTLAQRLRVLQEHVLSDADISLVNLEAPIFRGSQARQGRTAILSNEPDVLDIFAKPQTVVCNLCNNHIMDFGEEGLIATRQLLQKRGFLFLGAGSTRAEAEGELVVRVADTNVGFLSFTSNESHVGSVVVGDRTPGCASIDDINNALKRVAEVRRNVDLLVVSLHWGHEYHFYPSDNQRKTAMKLLECGVDVLVGHHPHVIQGTQEHENRVIFYSLGNFFFSPFKSVSGRPNTRKEYSSNFIVPIVNYDPKTRAIHHEVRAGKIDGAYSIKFWSGADFRRFQRKYKVLSEPLYRNDYARFWDEYRAKRTKQLRVESLGEAARKLFTTPLPTLLRTFTPADLSRNVRRVLGLFFRTR